jgi:hypothetical protein
MKYISKRIRAILFYIALTFLMISISCKKFIEVDPPVDRITDQNVFDNDFTAIAAVTGIYANISASSLNTVNLLTISKFAGLSSDELSPWTGAPNGEKAYYKNMLASSVGGSGNFGGELWNVCYAFIFDCNQIIEGLSRKNDLTSTIREQLLGEAMFLRSFLYFYLVNFYGDVPLVTGIDPEVNRLVVRTAKSKVYDFIIADLRASKGLLSKSYLDHSLKPYDAFSERVRPTSWAASALLARVYLYTSDFLRAQEEATEIINASSIFDLSGVQLDEVFLKNSTEAIWQLQPVINGWNTQFARLFNLSASPVGFTATKNVFINPSLYEAFEKGDYRQTNWTKKYNAYYFSFKYKANRDATIIPSDPGPITEYHMVFRLAEVYLIRAEARARTGNITEAVADLNIIRTRARAVPTVDVPNPLPDLPSSLSEAECLDAILKERRVELFMEWGHRWLDLKRTNTIDSVMGIVTLQKGSTWESSDQLYPLPIEDIIRNPNLVQNTGY